MMAKAEIQPQTGGPLEKADQPDSSSTEGPLSGDNTDTKRGKDAVFIEPVRTVTGVNVPVFEAGSALCSAASNMTSLIVGRALCGLDGVGMYLGVVVLIAATMTIQERPAYLASIRITRACLSLHAPDPQPGVTILQRLVEIGWIGAPLMLGSIVCFTLGISRAHRLSQYYHTIILIFCITAAGGCAIFVPVYLVPIFFQSTRGDSAINAAVPLLPFSLVMVTVTLTHDGMPSHPSGKFGLYMPTAWIYGASAMLVAGVETFPQAGFSIAQASVPAPKAAVASFLIPLAQTNGINIALAVSNAVFLNRAEKRLTAILPDTVTEAQIQAAIAGVGTDFVTTLSPRMQQEVLEAIVEALNLPYILVVTAGALVLAGSVLMKRERLLMPADVGV
ncbi:uncharacterized protein CLUP02_04999 [Colletotrichum lupini]|uniref:Uncharacterized protein n=1 Tax=Colletotrichum lupini TaxID=145971 RepID=A0A9Q8SLC5_9PEZI|nr:uncharacterized protein CLUP02_04999 [Colletotrichum lupini]UQC79519.1 hypothetical protein CLUP02_04999 [Colletotrichum lupini]